MSSFGNRNAYGGLNFGSGSSGLSPPRQSTLTGAGAGLGGMAGLPSFGGGGGGGGGGGVSHPSIMSSSSHAPAIESLTLTAQSVGLSIEQLAAALSTSPNLKSLSLTDKNNTESQKDLALSLYRTESLALYRRCMLLAGFDNGAIEENSPEYLQFAFKAWQEEGKRLQDLLGMEMSLQAPVVANLQQQQQQDAQAKAKKQAEAHIVQAQAQAFALEQQQQKQELLLLQQQQQQQQNGGGGNSMQSLLYGNNQNQSGGAGGANSQLYKDAMQRRLTEMQLLKNSNNSFL